MSLNPVELTKQLISFPSISPDDKGAIEFLSDILEKLGFKCTILDFGDESVTVRNLYAQYGTVSPNLCFAGHVDVVPPGDLNEWLCDPFSPEIRDGVLYGRGAVDMKSAICSFICAVSKINLSAINGSISLLITSDEEAANFRYGTPAVLKWLQEQGKKIDFCIVGEATSNKTLGDIIKIGRRGAVTFFIECYGIQGHVAYHQLADNPINKMINILHKIKNTTFDEGTEHFQPTHCEITTVDTNNPASNVTPSKITSRLNIRFSTQHTQNSLHEILDNICSSVTHNYKLTKTEFGDAFLTKPDKNAEIMKTAIKECTGIEAEYSTSGGTSDARFIKDYCSVIEFGLLSQTAHHINENTSVANIHDLTEIYNTFINKFFHKT